MILITGVQRYGVHLGCPKQPMEESDPWIEGEGSRDALPISVIHNQRRILVEAAEKLKWDWVITYPNDVIGVAKGNFMNLSIPWGIYAAIHI